MRYPSYVKAKSAVEKHVYPNDRGYCTVLATAQVTDCSLSKAYHTNKQYGRLDRQGMNMTTHLLAVRSLGVDIEMVEGVCGLTVNQALKKINDKIGAYLIYVNQHVFVYREGDVRDWHQLPPYKNKAIRKKVFAMFKVTKQKTN